MSYPELLLSNQLCFLVHRLDLAIGAKYRSVLAELGLTYGQYLAMLVLWEHRALRVGEMCRLLRLETGTISPLLKRLEASGYVVRKRGIGDDRAVTVGLTQSGEELERRARSVPAAVAQSLTTDETDYKQIRAILERLIRRVEATPSESLKAAVQD